MGNSTRETAATLFQKTQPLGFNLFDDDDQQVLYIDDNGHNLHLEIRNTSRYSIKLLEPANGAVTADAENNHFELRFRPGTLLDPAVHKPALAAPEGWSLESVNHPDGTVSLYFLVTDAASAPLIEPDSGSTLVLQNVSADGYGGARGTRVEFRYGRLLTFAGSATPLTGTLVQHLSIVNARGKKNIPLHVGFLGSNTILNDGQSDNEVTLRITNPLRDDSISLSASGDARSKFVLSFDVQDTESKDWALMTTGQSGAVQVRVKFPPETGEKIVSRAGGGQAESPEWIIENSVLQELKPREHIEVRISGIKSSLPSGMTNLYVRYENIPGYWDGQFVVSLEKSNLVQRDQMQGNVFAQSSFIGIGTSAPKAKLQIEGGSLSINGEGTGITVDEGNKKRVGLIKYPGRSAGLWRTKNLNFEIGRLDVAELPGSPDAGKFTADLTIDAAGNIKIGDLARNARLTVDSGGGEAISLFCEHRGSNFIVRPAGSGGNSTVLENTGGGALLINPKGGSVGIGTTNAGSNRLAIVGALANDSVADRQHELQLEIRNGMGTQGTRSVALGLLNSGKGVLQVKECNVGYNDLLLNPVNGNVGIGTATPDRRLTIQGSEGTYLNVKANSGAYEILLGADVSGGIVSTMTGHDLQLRAGGNNTRMIVKAGGNVGIGTNDPQAKLDVAGDARVTGKITIGEWTLESRRDGAWGSPNSALFITWKGRDIARFGTLRDMLQIKKYDGNGNYRGYFFINEDGDYDNN